MSVKLALVMLAVCLTMSARPVAAQGDKEPEQTRIGRLETLADVWGKIYLFHPKVVSSDTQLDWHKVLVEAIPKVERAQSTEEFIEVLNKELLKHLNDPLTFARKRKAAAGDQPEPESPELKARMLQPSVGYVDLRPIWLGRNQKLITIFNDAVKSLGGAQLLIVDLRQQRPSYPVINLLRFFVAEQVSMSSSVRRQHFGWSESQTGNVYSQKWEINNGYPMVPIKDDPYLKSQLPADQFAALQVIKTPTVVLINNGVYELVAPFLDTLQAHSNVAVIWEQSGENRTPNLFSNETVKYPHGVEVRINQEMLISHKGKLGFQPDLVSESSIADERLVETAQAAMAAKQSGAKPASFNFNMRSQRLEMAPKESLTREERLLGLFKVRAVISHMFPHLEFASINMNTMLTEWIPRVEAAQTMSDYYIQLQMLAAQLNDSHVGVYHSSLRPGNFTIPARFGRVEGKVVVIETREEGGKLPISVGDEIIEIDGKTVKEFEAIWRPRVSASTEQARARAMYQVFLGEKDSELKLTVKRGGKLETVAIKRTMTQYAFYQPAANATQAKMLANNIGYINLITLPNKDALIKALNDMKESDGLIFDLRGYPSFWVTLELTSRLIDKPVKSTIFETPIVNTFNPLTTSWHQTQYQVEPDAEFTYRKPVVVLINEEAQSMPEDFCIYLKNANRVTFVGATTTGTNGNVTFLTLPGGGSMSFTGMRVKYGNGERFQNIGIIPDVKVERTVSGMAAGKDEIMEKAIETLTTETQRAKR